MKNMINELCLCLGSTLTTLCILESHLCKILSQLTNKRSEIWSKGVHSTLIVSQYGHLQTMDAKTLHHTSWAYVCLLLKCKIEGLGQWGQRGLYKIQSLLCNDSINIY